MSCMFAVEVIAGFAKFTFGKRLGAYSTRLSRNIGSVCVACPALELCMFLKGWLSWTEGHMPFVVRNGLQ